jgi:antirestriction protein ArdC
MEGFLPLIAQILEADKKAPKKQRHTAQRVDDRLVAEHAFEGSYSSVKEADKADAGISPPTIEQSAAYIDAWRKKLQDDKRLVVQAAGLAQRAADRVLGVTFEADSVNEPTEP